MMHLRILRKHDEKSKNTTGDLNSFKCCIYGMLVKKGVNMNKPKYHIDDITRVHYYMNYRGMTKGNAIKTSKFSDSSAYYRTLKRLGLTETISYKYTQSYTFEQSRV